MLEFEIADSETAFKLRCRVDKWSAVRMLCSGAKGGHCCFRSTAPVGRDETDVLKSCCGYILNQLLRAALLLLVPSDLYPCAPARSWPSCGLNPARGSTLGACILGVQLKQQCRTPRRPQCRHCRLLRGCRAVRPGSSWARGTSSTHSTPRRCSALSRARHPRLVVPEGPQGLCNADASAARLHSELVAWCAPAPRLTGSGCPADRVLQASIGGRRQRRSHGAGCLQVELLHHPLRQIRIQGSGPITLQPDL